MLNPGFRLLDPEPGLLEPMIRLSPAAGEDPSASSWAKVFQSVSPSLRDDLAQRLTAALAVPGTHSVRKIMDTARSLAHQHHHLSLPDPKTFGWSDYLLARVADAFPEPTVLLLGILNADGLVAGGVSGVANGGLDFVTAFKWLWSYEPELEIHQKILDIIPHARTAKVLFQRPAGGLFIYYNEFVGWRDGGWNQGQLEEYVRQGNACIHWPE